MRSAEKGVGGKPWFLDNRVADDHLVPTDDLSVLADTQLNILFYEPV